MRDKRPRSSSVSSGKSMDTGNSSKKHKLNLAPRPHFDFPVDKAFSSIRFHRTEFTNCVRTSRRSHIFISRSDSLIEQRWAHTSSSYTAPNNNTATPFCFACGSEHGASIHLAEFIDTTDSGHMDSPIIESPQNVASTAGVDSDRPPENDDAPPLETKSDSTMPCDVDSDGQFNDPDTRRSEEYVSTPSSTGFTDSGTSAFDTESCTSSGRASHQNTSHTGTGHTSSPDLGYNFRPGFSRTTPTVTSERNAHRDGDSYERYVPMCYCSERCWKRIRIVNNFSGSGKELNGTAIDLVPWFLLSA
ncbi:hypothetical protein EXIGLDRAFT_756536 [Exidia glandulosa HHB12029]|uniref:Uncharacterized protein n=1 Tax=Exidia glandulosa HHB12029 TaxID=1314781 RepID=A0A165B811_EXIGL|nr:hypothetical protein EXIGLDRAFT_756536 [Exidia glandulosa HHB12029]